MQLNECGFYVPLVDRKLCSECSICTFFCPVLTHHKGKVESVPPKAFASWSLDDQTRLQSSSGGIFSELASYVLDRGGIVFACVWGDGPLPRHEKIGNLTGLVLARGSKYLQSNVGHTYARAVEQSKLKEILFVGTPCQAAAMRRFIRKDSAHRILIVDLVCHGTASIRVFHSYLEFLFGGEKAQHICFRDKVKGWKNYQFTAISETGKKFSREHYYDPFFVGYLQNLYLNSICYNCPFSALPRQGDITLGDFWGVPKHLFDEKGVSVVLATTEEGDKIINNLKEAGRIALMPVEFNQAAASNPRMTNGHIELPAARALLLRDLASGIRFQTIHEKYIRVPTPFRQFASRIKRMSLKGIKHLLGKAFL